MRFSLISCSPINDTFKVCKICFCVCAVQKEPLWFLGFRVCWIQEWNSIIKTKCWRVAWRAASAFSPPAQVWPVCYRVSKKHTNYRRDYFHSAVNYFLKTQEGVNPEKGLSLNKSRSRSWEAEERWGREEWGAKSFKEKPLCARGTKRRRLDERVERKRREKNPSLFAEVERWGGGGETEERRRHPCVLHLIRPPIEGYNFHKREGGRIYTRGGSWLKSSCAHTHTHSAGYLSSVNELRLTDSPVSLSHWSY